MLIFYLNRVDGKCETQLTLSLRVLSNEGHWLCMMSSNDRVTSLFSAFDAPVGESDRKLCICFSYSWTLSVPMQNIEEGALIIFEFTDSVTGTVVGWSYIQISSDPAQANCFQGLKSICVLPTSSPVSLVPGESVTGCHSPLPALPSGSMHDFTLHLECCVQSV